MEPRPPARATAFRAERLLVVNPPGSCRMSGLPGPPAPCEHQTRTLQRTERKAECTSLLCWGSCTSLVKNATISVTGSGNKAPYILCNSHHLVHKSACPLYMPT